MNTIKKEDIIRLHSGETCKVIGLPGTFMSNGSYEIVEIEGQVSGKVVYSKNKKWVKEKDIAYVLSTDQTDPITNYIETVYGEEGDIHLIPKNLNEVQLIEEDGFRTIRLVYENKNINILIGENEIKNENK